MFFNFNILKGRLNSTSRQLDENLVVDPDSPRELKVNLKFIPDFLALKKIAILFIKTSNKKEKTS